MFTQELRLREAAQYGDWQAKEESFHQKTMQEGSRIRIKEGREKIVDEILKQAASTTVNEYGFEMTGLEIKHFNYVRPDSSLWLELVQRTRHNLWRIRLKREWEAELSAAN